LQSADNGSYHRQLFWNSGHFMCMTYFIHQNMIPLIVSSNYNFHCIYRCLWCRNVLKFKVRYSDVVKFCKSLGPHGGSSSYNDLLGVYTVLYKNVVANPFIPFFPVCGLISSKFFTPPYTNDIFLYSSTSSCTWTKFSHPYESSMLFWNVMTKQLYYTV
jgi:hypothetical protein